MLGELGGARLAMGHYGYDDGKPMELRGRIINPQLLRSSSSIRHLLRPDAHPEPAHSRFANSHVSALSPQPLHWCRRRLLPHACLTSLRRCGDHLPSPTVDDARPLPSQLQGPSQLGGNPGRISSSDAAILANASGPIGLMSHGAARPRPKPTPNPITGEAVRIPPPPRSLRGSFSASSLGGSQGMLFPARGTINSIGSISTGESPLRKSPSRRAGKLEYEVWCEAQRRQAAERELRQVIIHGRSRPPWVGDAEASGYRSLSKSDLMAQTR